MLRADVVAAVENSRFQVYAVESVDEAMELLCGIPAGTADAAGDFPPTTVNGRVAASLARLADIAREAAVPPATQPVGGTPLG
jgi:hypothetical protein